jgi:hypothetical protein
MKLFDDLEYMDKTEVLKKAGIPVLIAYYGDYCVTLYLVADFFVERYFDCRSNSMGDIRSVNYTDLDKYLEEIQIDDLFKRV